MRKKYFETFLAIVSVLILMFLTSYVLYLRNQLNDFEYYIYLSHTRDEWQLPEKVIEAIGIHQGDVIADIGAGSGYFTFKFARAVGPEGKVYALEISDLAINIIKKIVLHSQMKGVNFDNIIVMKTRKDSTCLDENILDIAFMCELHFYRYKNLNETSKKMIDSIYKSLKKGGRLVIIEKYKRRSSTRIETTNLGIIRRNFETRGFKFIKSYDFLPLQFFLIFEK